MHEELEFNPYLAPTSPLSHFDRVDDLRDRYGSFYSTYGPGFWVFTSDATVRRILRAPDIFSSRSVLVTEPDPPPYPLIPEYSDPPEHTYWRRLLAPVFAPARIDTMTKQIHERCTVLVGPLAERGECDFVPDFAQRFPVEVFMDLLGLPSEQVEQFMAWERDMLHLREGTPAEVDRQMAARAAVEEYFIHLLDDRRRTPRDDLVSEALSWRLNGAPIPRDDLLSLLTLLFMAGLDTVSAQLSYAFLHLATHPGDRQRLAADPRLVPSAVEEHLRCFSGTTFGRQATRDVEVDGCPVKAGDRMYLPLSAAGRDPAAHDRAREVVIDRPNNDHIAFGHGPHKCVGMHLARRQLNVAYEVWHAAIPDYWLLPGSSVEAHGGVLGLDALPLVWH